MSNEDLLNKSIGTKDRPTLEAKDVEIIDAKIEAPKEGSKAQIAKFICHHPDAKEILGLENIEISQVKVENPSTHKMEFLGLWINLDADGNLLRNSPLAMFLRLIGASSVKGAVGKKVKTVQRENKFLAFQGY